MQSQEKVGLFYRKFISPGPEGNVHIPLSYLGGIPHYLSFNIYYITHRFYPGRNDTTPDFIRFLNLIVLACGNRLIPKPATTRHLPEGWANCFLNATASLNTSLNLSGYCQPNVFYILINMRMLLLLIFCLMFLLLAWMSAFKEDKQAVLMLAVAYLCIMFLSILYIYLNRFA